MSGALELESTLTDRYQTTIPNAVRRTLHLGKRDKLRYTLQPSGEVLLTRVGQKDVDDPVIGLFLDFLARDMHKHPRRIRAIDAKWLKQLRSLVRGVKVDIDAPLSPDND